MVRGDLGRAAELFQEIGTQPEEAYCRLTAALERGDDSTSDGVEAALAFYRRVGASALRAGSGSAARGSQVSVGSAVRSHMESYDVFAQFYDAVQGDRAEHADYLRSLIEKHHPGATTLLELACGTGSLLKQLEPAYEVSGVDLSEAMLAVAADKVPSARLVHEDMTRVEPRRDVRRRPLRLRLDQPPVELRAVAGGLPTRVGAPRTTAASSCSTSTPSGSSRSSERQHPWAHWFGDENLL